MPIAQAIGSSPFFLHRVWPECAPGHKNGRRARMEQKRARALVFNQWVKSFGAP